MKIVVIGGTGLIGSKTVAILRQGGHEVVAASPKGGVNTVTGEGLKEAMAGAQVVIDVSNAPSFDTKAVLEFFETAGRNLLAAEAAASVRHHVALSIVGTDWVPDQGYFRAKVAQEKLIEASGISYTIVRSTQFLEFLGGIADASTDGSVVRPAPSLFQPIAADDVAAVVAEVALADPRNGIAEIAGPERAGRGASRPPQSRGVVTPLVERNFLRPSHAASTLRDAAADQRALALKLTFRPEARFSTRVIVFQKFCPKQHRVPMITKRGYL